VGHGGRAAGFGIDDEIVLRDGLAAFDAPALPHIDLPWEKIALFKILRHAVRNGAPRTRLRPARFCHSVETDQAHRVVEVKLFELRSRLLVGVRPGPAHARAVERRERLDETVDLKFGRAHRAHREYLPELLHASAAEILPAAAKILQMLVVGVRFRNRQAVFFVGGDDAARAEGLDRDRGLAGLRRF